MEMISQKSKDEDQIMEAQHNGVERQSTVVLKSLRHDPGITIDWESEEQSILEYSMNKYASEVSVVRHASIAQAILGKTIRDVVLRIKWMNDKEKCKSDDISCTSQNEFGCEGLIEHNAQVLDKIEANNISVEENISELKIYENIDLLSQARNNLLEILKDLPFCDGMPHFPFKLNQELTDSALSQKSPPKN